jgi:hypothetical protein
MIRKLSTAILVSLVVCSVNLAQAPSRCSPASSVWNALRAPAMDPGKSAHAENIQIVRDRIHIALTDGTIDFTQPINKTLEVRSRQETERGGIHAVP